jgi:hypothetical protein
MVKLSPQTELVFALRTGKNPKTIRRYFAGRSVRPGTAEAIERVVEKLKSEGVELVVADEAERAQP